VVVLSGSALREDRILSYEPGANALGAKAARRGHGRARVHASARSGAAPPARRSL